MLTITFAIALCSLKNHLEKMDFISHSLSLAFELKCELPILLKLTRIEDYLHAIYFYRLKDAQNLISSCSRPKDFLVHTNETLMIMQ